MRRPFASLILPLLFALLCAPAPAQAQAQQSSVLEDIIARGQLRVGLSSFTPWAMRATNGEFIGFEVDVAQAVAQDMGVELELVPVSWDGIIPALLGKKFDIIIGGMSITPERNLKVNFTDVYDESGLDLVANRKLAAGMALADYNSPDVSFALRRGAYPVAWVKQNLPQATILQFDDDISALQEVINGNAHAHIGAAPTPAFAAADNPNILFSPLDGYLTTNIQAMALRKSDFDALNYFNNWILVRKHNGWLQDRHNYWFKSRDWSGLVGKE